MSRVVVLYRSILEIAFVFPHIPLIFDIMVLECRLGYKGPWEGVLAVVGYNDPQSMLCYEPTNPL